MHPRIVEARLPISSPTAEVAIVVDAVSCAVGLKLSFKVASLIDSEPLA